MADGSAPACVTQARLGKWTITYLPPVPERGCFKFQHDEFDGTPDMLDPRQGLAPTLDACLARIAEIEAAEPTRG